MDYSKLLYYKTLVDEMNYTHAAQKLYISQSNLSDQIQRIERELNCQLLIRNKRVLSVTPNGKLFYDFCCLSLQNYYQMKSQLTNKNTFNIGFVYNSHIKDWIKQLKQLNVNNAQQIKTTVINNCDITEPIISGKFDLAFSYFNPFPIQKRLVYQPVTKVSLNFFYQKENLDLKRLDKVTTYVINYNNFVDTIMTKMIIKAGLDPLKIKSVDNEKILKQNLNQNNSITLSTVNNPVVRGLIPLLTEDYLYEMGWYFKKRNSTVSKLIQMLA